MIKAINTTKFNRQVSVTVSGDGYNENREESEENPSEEGHSAQLCDSDLAFWQDKHHQNSFAVLAPPSLRLVVQTHQDHVECVFCVRPVT